MAMRFFIFPLDNIYIAVAADNVKCFISSDAIDSFAGNNNDQESTGYVKIPVYMIFGKRDCAGNALRHGIVLKHETGASGADGRAFIIITPPVERDIFVDEQEIQGFPGSFSGVYSSFNGLYFSGQKVILFLDIEKFTSFWLNKPEWARLDD